MKGLFDTNVLIDYLNGIDAARIELDRFETRLISPITWMEVMIGASPGTEDGTRGFLAGFQQQHIDPEVAETAVEIRRHHRIRLPDAIIWASARCSDSLLVTRNRRDFPEQDPGIRFPYEV
jgi:predicted nucleic acid-binding protein